MVNRKSLGYFIKKGAERGTQGSILGSLIFAFFFPALMLTLVVVRDGFSEITNFLGSFPYIVPFFFCLGILYSITPAILGGVFLVYWLKGNVENAFWKGAFVGVLISILLIGFVMLIFNYFRHNVDIQANEVPGSVAAIISAFVGGGWCAVKLANDPINQADSLENLP